MTKKSETDEEDRNKIVRSFLNTYSIDDSGNIAIHNFWAFLHYKNFLTFNLLYNEKFEQKFDEARYWFPFPNNPMSNSTLDSIESQLKIENIAKIENCKILLQKKLLEIQEKPIQKYNLYFFLDITPTPDFIPFSLSLDDISADIFIISPSKEPLSNPAFAVKLLFINNREKNQYRKDGILCLHLVISARNQHYAMKEGIQYTRFILGLIGLINNLNSGHTYTFDFPHSYANCPSPSLLFVANEQKECVGDLIWKFEGIQKDCLIPTEELKKKCSIYSNGTLEARKIVLSSINAYYTGLHEDNMGFSLLAFWASLERLCLKDEGLSHKKMLNRLFNLVPPSSKVELKMLLDIRNKAIHQWKYNAICEYERHLVKNYTDLLFDFFMKHLMSFNEVEIELFFSQFNCNSAILQTFAVTNNKVFDLLMKMRDNKGPL